MRGIGEGTSDMKGVYEGKEGVVLFRKGEIVGSFFEDFNFFRFKMFFFLFSLLL